MYTIGQVAEQFGLPVSTLRYYDKEGLFPNLTRASGARRFGERELERLRVIECLKASGLEIRDIRQFMQWCTEGAGSYPKRRELLERQKETLEAQMDDLRRSLAMLQFKCWYYEQAVCDGNEQRLQAMTPQEMPAKIRRAYENAHSEGNTACLAKSGGEKAQQPAE